ncbi:hypothetical protein JZ751_022218 [Albula glossodonta]|uniref:Uncharacterized protein n=1 Tax=Albula glossodonta TaxID=121402 RepID=A0A8T2NHM1_9TELE|nr:hypothetical protein JZ751_022218 [Albula glossodonta]
MEALLHLCFSCDVTPAPICSPPVQAIGSAISPTATRVSDRALRSVLARKIKPELEPGPCSLVPARRDPCRTGVESWRLWNPVTISSSLVACLWSVLIFMVYLGRRFLLSVPVSSLTTTISVNLLKTAKSKQSGRDQEGTTR